MVAGTAIEQEDDMKGEVTVGSLRQEPGGLWDSLKKAAFVVGSGLLFLAAFGNSLTWYNNSTHTTTTTTTNTTTELLTWHLQRFWGASGHFWQDLWTRLNQRYEGHEASLFFLGTMMMPFVTFWGANALLLLVDITGKPSFITRYRIQVDKNSPVDLVKLRNAVKVVLLNQLFISTTMVVGVYYLMKLRGEPCSPDLPTFHHALLEMAVFSLVEEVFFYYSHRMFHHPALYKHFHKQHHEWTAPIGVVSIYAHPLEHILSNMLPALLGPVIMGSHLSTTTLWYCLALLSTTISHSGYHLPLLPSPEFHDFHHYKFNQNFGVLGVLDRLHGTDAKFRKTKQYERHSLLLGITPLTESIPDAPKKGY